MNRIYKFRAWDKRTKDMLYFDILEAFHYYNLVDIRMKGEVILMQYTTLKDSKGVEIYDGDIIKADGIFEVVWHAGGFCMIRRLPTDDATELEQLEWYLPHSIENKGFDKEVIGNIYQNKDLLNEE